MAMNKSQTEDYVYCGGDVLAELPPLGRLPSALALPELSDFRNPADHMQPSELIFSSDGARARGFERQASWMSALSGGRASGDGGYSHHALPFVDVFPHEEPHAGGGTTLVQGQDCETDHLGGLQAQQDCIDNHVPREGPVGSAKVTLGTDGMDCPDYDLGPRKRGRKAKFSRGLERADMEEEVGILQQQVEGLKTENEALMRRLGDLLKHMNDARQENQTLRHLLAQMRPQEGGMDAIPQLPMSPLAPETPRQLPVCGSAGGGSSTTADTDGHAAVQGLRESDEDGPGSQELGPAEGVSRASGPMVLKVAAAALAANKGNPTAALLDLLNLGMKRQASAMR